MSISFKCPNCQTKYSATLDQVGKEGTCKKCGARMKVPEIQSEYSKSELNVENESSNSSKNQIEKKPKFWGPNIAIALGILTFLGALVQVGSGQAAVNPMTGVFIIMGALVYKSIKKRKHGLTTDTILRMTLEIATLLLIIILVLSQNHYPEYLERNPFSNFIIPLSILLACGPVYFEGNKIWIITSITACFLLLVAVRSYFYYQDFGETNTSQNTSNRKFSNTKQIVSTDNLCQITIPEYWKELDNINDDAIIQVGNPQNEEYLIIIPDFKEDFSGTLEDYVDVTSENLLASIENASVSLQEKLTINDYAAIRFRITGTVDKINVIYLYTTIEAGKAYYQIFAWTLPSKGQKTLKTYTQVVNSFKEF